MKNYQRLRDVREDADKTQEEIAKILGIRQSDYGKYERGDNKMGIDKYIILAKYYNISIDYLVGIIPTPKRLYENKEYGFTQIYLYDTETGELYSTDKRKKSSK